MKTLLILLLFISTIFATENNATNTNSTIDKNVTKETNATKSNASLEEKNIQKAIENEKKFKQEQKFYMGDDYNLDEHKVDKKTVEKTPLIEPEYDFDITDLYAD